MVIYTSAGGHFNTMKLFFSFLGAVTIYNYVRRDSNELTLPFFYPVPIWTRNRVWSPPPPTPFVDLTKK